MKRKGLPSKYAKMGFKKGWAAFKRAAAAAKRRRTLGRPVKVAGRKKSTIKRRRTSGTAAPIRKTISRVGRSVSTMTRRRYTTGKRFTMKKISKESIKYLIDAGIVGGGAVVSGFVIDKIPVIKDQSTIIKNGTTAAIGAGMILLTKNKMARKIGAGFIAGSIINTAKGFINPPLTMGAREFTATELAELQTGKPVTIGRPVQVSGKRVLGYTRGKRSYAK